MAKKSGKSAPKKVKAAKTKKPLAKSASKIEKKNLGGSAPTGPRRIKPKQHKFLRFRNKSDYRKLPKLPSAWKITKESARTLWRYKGLLAGITLIYGVLNLLLTQSVSSVSDVSGLKHTWDQSLTGSLSSLVSGIGIFTLFVGSAGSGGSTSAGSYQAILVVAASLAMIYALRQSLSGNRLRIRDAYYGGMYPLIPFLLVLIVVGLELVPLVIGSTLYALVINNGIANNGSEKIFWLVIFIISVCITVYLICSSLFALYIVTLPEMTPMKALRSARGLVRRRRWSVLRKILWLPLVLLVVAALIMVPIIIFVTPLARWMFFILTIFALSVTHTYMYTLYRELLNE